MSEELISALKFIQAFAELRSKDDAKVFARVGRGAMRTVAQKAAEALAPLGSDDPPQGLRPAGSEGCWVLVPRTPTMAMLNAAIDTDSFKLGDISPLGFRCSPQTMFERCYAAMLAAAPEPLAPPVVRRVEGKDR